MENLNKTSPFLFPNPAVKKEIRNGWEIALNYENENPSLAIVDLSHKNKWELYDQNLAGKPLDNLHIPKSAGEVTFAQGTIVSLPQPSVALIWQIDGFLKKEFFSESITEITDGYTLIALIGTKGPRIMEKLTDINLMSPSARQQIRLIQGPLLGIPAKFVLFSAESGVAGMLISFDRGSGQPLVDAILDAGMEHGLKPAGQILFDKWIQNFA